MNLRDALALNLRKLRRARGWSQEELAHRAEIDRTYISAIERRVYASSIDVLARLAAALELEATELLRAPIVRKKAASEDAPDGKALEEVRKERPASGGDINARAKKARRLNEPALEAKRSAGLKKGNKAKPEPT
jgi:transcriptional regulator with XRE-family HTH domain